ncbi:hypothetical protein Ae706Ps2_6727 [Pseudonocardia sp. Ae706_Ps2]|nr:hypothetical protein Ae706Ps2_6727 [Pseudonocardia sp. Ae706_Ps2]
MVASICSGGGGAPGVLRERRSAWLTVRRATGSRSVS